ncbi:sorbosone dehydrogenase family protein [Sphingomonas panacisoli]|uniref:Sorbosone dehydrogenase family protein n=1 Tax=Sphingomonas panacisoli TaxID=1813879 RepID=A0A5B8LKB3_9SPHN|nr:sorbosone dehydrogenase family protein [Sphingomonas panacisoli]QDZ08175.1 sorbosone dehydrogenase family protein [Sphingomonas panacisoli]
MRQKILIGLALVLALLGGLYLYFAQPDLARLSVAAVSGRTPQIDPPRNQIVPTIAVADAVGWKAGETPTPAAGLTVKPFAAGLDHPRWMYRLPNGDVLVAETNSPPREGGGITGLVMSYLLNKGGAGVPSANRITLLRDANGDGVAESRSVLLSGLNSPFGMALMGDYLYVADTDKLLRFPFKPGQTRITAKPETVVTYPGGGNHWARNIIVAEDGKSLYLTVGSSTNIAENGIDAERGRANILQVYPDQKGYRIYAAGTRNPNGLALEPHTNALWVTVNERDMAGSDGPPDYMSAVEAGDNFGWPWYYWGGYPDHRVKPGNPALQQYAKRPDYALGPHTASLGLTFAADARLGASYANGAFVGQHGSWNRQPVSGYKVIFVPFGDKGFPLPNVKPVDVLTGFLDKDGNARGRPVGVIFDASGSLLVADDVGNVIWRVSSATPQPAPAATPAAK